MCRQFWVKHLGCDHWAKDRFMRCPDSSLPIAWRPDCFPSANLPTDEYPEERTRYEDGLCGECAVGLHRDLEGVFELRAEVERYEREVRQEMAHRGALDALSLLAATGWILMLNSMFTTVGS